MSDLPLVSVLFVTYNRPELLARTVHSFLQHTKYPQLELVVTDDASTPNARRAITELPFHVFVLADENRGLGANLNAGLRRCSGRYILVLQDDWDCVAPPDYLRNTIAVMQENPQIGFVNFYGAQHEIASAPLPGSDEPCHEIVNEFFDGERHLPIYTDTPHVVAAEAVRCLGYYREGCRMEQCELDYAARFAAQRKIKAALFPAHYNRAFLHTGEQQSFRTRTVRHRVETWLHPCGRALKRRCPFLYVPSRSLVRGLIDLIG